MKMNKNTMIEQTEKAETGLCSLVFPSVQNHGVSRDAYSNLSKIIWHRGDTFINY